MKTWVKLYTEINRDPTLGELTWAQRGIWGALLALAGEIDARDEEGNENGELDTIERVAWRIRCDVIDLQEAITAFEERGMVDGSGDVLYLCNYARCQARAPSASRRAVAERVQRHRAQDARECSEDVTRCNEGVTRVKRGVTPSDTDPDTDTNSDTDSDIGAKAQPSDPPPDPPPKKKPKSRADPRTKSTPIQAIRAVIGGRRYPPRELYDTIISVVGNHPDMALLKACRAEWITRGYNPNSWKWLTEWYSSGRIPPQAQGKSQSVLAQTQAALDAYQKRIDGG